MTTLTIRIEESLKKDAARLAKELGIPLTLVIKTALKNFVASPKVLIGEPERVSLSEELQAKIDRLEEAAQKLNLKRLSSAEEQLKDI
jgi:antitoxin component of RelBE/YafQ-DinJ toxin-antitoxin module